MGNSSGFPIAYSRCSWACLCDIKTADKIKVAHYPIRLVVPNLNEPWYNPEKWQRSSK